MSAPRWRALRCPRGTAQRSGFRGGVVHPNAAGGFGTTRQGASPRRLLAADVYRATRQRPWRTPRRSRVVRWSAWGLLRRQEQVGDGFNLGVKLPLPRLKPLPVEQAERGMLGRRRDGEVFRVE